MDVGPQIILGRPASIEVAQEQLKLQVLLFRLAVLNWQRLFELILRVRVAVFRICEAEQLFQEESDRLERVHAQFGVESRADHKEVEEVKLIMCVVLRLYQPWTSHLLLPYVITPQLLQTAESCQSLQKIKLESLNGLDQIIGEGEDLGAPRPFEGSLYLRESLEEKTEGLGVVVLVVLGAEPGGAGVEQIYLSHIPSNNQLCLFLFPLNLIMLKQEPLKALVQKTLQLSSHVAQYIADMLVEDPPFNELQTLDLLQDFLVSGSVRKEQASEMCAQLFALLKQQGTVTIDSKFNLTAEKLPTPIILGETLLLQNQEEFEFKRMTGGNSNNEMVSYQKKERKKDKEQDRAKKMFEQHHEAMKDHMKKLPPTIVNHSKGVPKDLIIDKVNLIVGGRYLLQQATLKLVYGRKYGLVGRNGIGKTCLMNALARNQFGFHGMQILLVEQEVKETEKTALNTVLQTDVERLQLLEEEKQIVEKDGNVARLQSIHQRMQEIDAHTAQVRAQIILGGLGFTPSMMQKMVKELSGGWRMRVALARALFVQPEILLLDEPTNHLDLDAVMWLQDYISKSKATVVVVSHARQFLNVVCTDIVHFVEQKLVNYRGDYDCFQKTRYEKLTRQKQAFDNQQSKISHMQEFIDKFRYNAKRASLVQSRIKAIQKLERIDEVIEDPTCVFIFPNPDKLRPPLLRIQDGSFGYVPQQTILRNVNIGVDMQSRIAIVGANGVGKSTLLKLLVGSIQLNEGNQSRNPKLKVSIFTQHHIDTLDLLLTPLEQFMRDFPGATQQSYRNHLGSFGIGGNLALRPQYLLSGGQKSRVAFALAVYTVPHLLVLDEPTNHLDIDAVNALIIALNNYSGGVIIVSHDQHLIATVCDNIWYIKDSRLKKFSGDFQDYRKALSLGRL